MVEVTRPTAVARPVEPPPEAVPPEPDAPPPWRALVTEPGLNRELAFLPVTFTGPAGSLQGCDARAWQAFRQGFREAASQLPEAEALRQARDALLGAQARQEALRQELQALEGAELDLADGHLGEHARRETALREQVALIGRRLPGLQAAQDQAARALGVAARGLYVASLSGALQAARAEQAQLGQVLARAVPPGQLARLVELGLSVLTLAARVAEAEAEAEAIVQTEAPPAPVPPVRLLTRQPDLAWFADTPAPVGVPTAAPAPGISEVEAARLADVLAKGG